MWGDRITVAAAGSRVAIELDGLDETQKTGVREVWLDAIVDASDAGAAVVVPVREAALEDLLAHLSQQVTLEAIEQGPGRCWMLHAVGVALDTGAVVVLAGPSGRGKTTAARSLGRIDDAGGVLAYRKPLSVIEDACAPKRQLAPSRVGLRPLPDAQPRVAAIALVDQVPGARRSQ
jgi:ABC-type microcin C transport system duplicated ATPase subunit YejF